MSYISKVFFLSLIIFLFSFLSLLAGQPVSDIFGFSQDELSEGGEIPVHKSTNASVNLVEQKTLEAVIDDFQVNDDTTGGCEQSYPAIARGASGNFVVTWHDYRSAFTDIYAQRYDSSGTPIGSNFKVNDNAGTFYQYYPVVCMDGSNNFIIIWEDGRNFNSDIYAQRYDSSGTPIGSNFKVNDDAGTANQSFSAVAMDSSGSFLITWYDSRNGNPDIYAQRYSSFGTPVGSNFKANDDTGTTEQYYPAVALNGSGSFVITWEDNRNADFDIYSQRYDSTGTPIGSNFKVNDDTGTAIQNYPDVALDSSGNFVIIWQDKRNGNHDIYTQRYNSSGTPTGSNFKVNDDAGSAGQSFPAVSMNYSGNFVITWHDYRNGNSDIYAQRYDSSGTPIGSNFKANDDAGSDSQEYPAVAMDGSGNFVITWRDYRNADYDIYSQRHDFSGTPLGSNFRVNDDIGTADQSSPVIAMDDTGNFVITWYDYRNGNSDIYAQRYDSSGTPSGSNFRVNDDAGTAGQNSPFVAMDGSGNFVITWYDYRNANYDIYSQRYDLSGTPLGSNFRVNDDAGAANQSSPVIAMDGSGNFVITWYDYRNGNSDIYAQRYNSSGTPLGSNFRVDDDTGNANQNYPDVAMDNSGSFVISWEDSRNGTYDIYAQRYNSSGIALGTNYRVNSDAGTATQLHPAVAMDGSGNFVIAWYDWRNGNPDIYAQRYISSGTPSGSNFKANDDAGSDGQYSPAVAMNGSGNFVITWYDYRNGKDDIFAQRYNSAGYPIGANYLVSDYLYASFAQRLPVAAANNYYIYFTWQDNRKDKGWDIYANGYYFWRGNVNGDGQVSLSDIVYLISYLYKLGPEPIPEEGIGDANCDGQVSLSDIVYLISYLYKLGSPPCP